MTEPALRPIGSTFTSIEETEAERVITTWRVIGYAMQHEGMVELAMPISVTRQPKTKLGGKERKQSDVP